MGTSKAAAAMRANAQNAREHRARTLAAQENGKENAPRVSSRTVEKLQTKVAETTSTIAALQERTNTLMHQRDAHAQAKLRQQSASETQQSALRAAHAETVTGLSTTIATLEVQLSKADATIIELRKKLKAADMSLTRLRESRDAYCARAIQKATATTTTFQLKESGRYTDSVRALVADLVCLGKVPTEHVALVIQLVADCAGLTVLPARLISERTVGRCVGEAGAASEHQVAEAVNAQDVSGLCFGADSTSDRAMQFMSRHITAMTETGTATMYCLGLTRPVDHTAQTTHDEWLETVDDLASVHDRAISALSLASDSCNPAPPSAAGLAAALKAKFSKRRFWKKFRATNSDHASDMGLTTRLLIESRFAILILFRGLDALEELSAEAYHALYDPELAKVISDLGGSSVWLALADDVRSGHEQRVQEQLARRLGQELFDKLSPEEQEEERWFVRAGCCMHKDLNAVVAAVKRMAEVYAAAGLVNPIKLPNSSNAAAAAAAAAAGSSETQAYVDDISLCGAVKLVQLIGYLINNGDLKKGYGDPIRVFLRDKLGYSPTIPDTQQCRFQSTYEMARFVLSFRDELIDFLDLQRMVKTSRTFNNLEQNVWNGLHDGPTLSELVSLAAYGAVIGRPYMRYVRASALVNMMDLIPLHEEIIELLGVLSKCPEVIFLQSDDETSCPYTLDGEPLDDARLMSVIADLDKAGLLPHLDTVMKAFFTGACEGWTHFSVEFLPGGAIASATASQRKSLFIPSTNDSNEGLLGAYRVWKRLRPSMRLRFFNAAIMFRRNRTSAYLKQLDPRMRRFLRKEQRRREALKLSQREDRDQLAHDQEKRREGEAAAAKAAARVAKREQTLNAIAAIRFRSLATLLRFEANSRVTGSILDRNILWHRHRGTVETMKKLKKTRPLPTRVAGKRALLESILRFQTIPSAYGGPEDPFPYDGSVCGVPESEDMPEDAMDCT